ncbi:MAG: MlaD family protein [Solirubrobacteraceae bacterium]
MRRAIKIHRWDFTAIAALAVVAVGVGAYILRHQPAFTFGQSFYTVRAQFASAAAVSPGQGQAVTIAGVQVGDVGAVALQGGRAVVTMDIDKRYAPIYRDATVLLRPRTPLKDMYLSLDPGDRSAGPIPDGGTLPVAATSPDVDFDQILGSLDADAREYLLLALSGGAQALHDPGAAGGAPSPAAVADLRGTLKRFAPLDRDTRDFATLLAARQQNIIRAIHDLRLVATSLGGVDTALASLISSANTNFSAISSQDANLQAALTLLPGTLQQTSQTLVKVRAFAGATGPTLQALLPFARDLRPALAAARPLFKDTTPVIAHQLRRFAVNVQPLARALEPAATSLDREVPALSRSLQVLNLLLNTLAYQPGGSAQGYLFWGAWLAHNAASLTDLQDAHGSIVQGIFMATCSQLQLLATIQEATPSLAALLDLLNDPDYTRICPGAGTL